MKTLDWLGSETGLQWIRSGGLAGALIIIASVSGVTAMVGPFSATCALLAILPKAPFSQPKTILLSHAICIAVGALSIMLPLPALAIAFIAAWIAIMAMSLCRALHAPAAAHAIILVLGNHDVFVYSLVAMLTACAFTLYAQVTAMLQARRTVSIVAS